MAAPPPTSHLSCRPAVPHAHSRVPPPLPPDNRGPLRATDFPSLLSAPPPPLPALRRSSRATGSSCSSGSRSSCGSSSSRAGAQVGCEAKLSAQRGSHWRSFGFSSSPRQEDPQRPHAHGQLPPPQQLRRTKEQSPSVTAAVSKSGREAPPSPEPSPVSSSSNAAAAPASAATDAAAAATTPKTPAEPAAASAAADGASGAVAAPAEANGRGKGAGSGAERASVQDTEGVAEWDVVAERLPNGLVNRYILPDPSSSSSTSSTSGSGTAAVGGGVALVRLSGSTSSLVRTEGEDGDTDGKWTVEARQRLDRTIGAVKRFALPAGFPDSVSPEYLQYMLWKFPVHVTGWTSSTLVTSTLLQAVGVGSGGGTAAAASAAAATAAIKWVTKDGIGAVGRLLVGGRFGSVFDQDPKQWRMYADLVGSSGSLFELATPLAVDQFLLLASLGNLTKAVAKGLKDPSGRVIQNHFALRENLGDVSAKEEVWKVGAQLLGLLLGVQLLVTDQREMILPTDSS